MLSAAEPRPWPGMPRNRANRIRSQLIKQNSPTPGLVNYVELLLQTGRDHGGDRTILLPDGVLAQAVEKGVGRLPRRDREAGKARAHQVEAEAAAPRNFRGVRQAFVDNLPRIAAEDLAELGS